MKLLLLFGTAALGIFTLSAGANAYTGYTTGLLLGEYAGYFGLGVMVVTDMFAPLVIVVERVYSKRLTLVNKLGYKAVALLGISLSVGCFWFSTSDAFSNAYTMHSSIQFDKSIIDLKDKKLDIVEQSNEIPKAQELAPYVNGIKRLKERLATNYKGQHVYGSGGKQTVWQVTNGCTSGVYFTDKKLHKDDCTNIHNYQDKITEINSNNKLRVVNLGTSLSNADAKIDLEKQRKEKSEQEGSSNPLIPLIISYVGESGDVKGALNNIAIFIAVLVELFKLSLISMFVVALFPKEEQKKTKMWNISGLLDEWKEAKSKALLVEAAAKGKEAARLESKIEEMNSRVVVFNSVKYMRGIEYTVLETLYDFDTEFNGTKIPKSELKLLLLMVVREYQPDEQLTLRPTLDAICERVNDPKSDYAQKVKQEFDISHEELILTACHVSKISRMRTKILPAMEKAGLVTSAGNNKTVYHWCSDGDIELMFKETLK